MSHANAALTPRQRLRIARLIIDDGWAIAHAADYSHVAWPTAQKWARRYAEYGIAGMTDRSSRPHTHPNQTPRPIVRKIKHLRSRADSARSRSAVSWTCPRQPCMRCWYGNG